MILQASSIPGIAAKTREQVISTAALRHIGGLQPVRRQDLRRGGASDFLIFFAIELTVF